MMAAWTREQTEVIGARNCDLLVSAAAGSGKTAVLVERIIRMITDSTDPVDIDHLLVVTFTRAAAGEMKERIRAALEKALKSDPSNSLLIRQSALVGHARIMTIDSFCMDIVRNHFHEIDLDPAFRVGDEGEMKLLRQDVLSQVMEEAYQEADPDVIRFTEIFAPQKSDEGITELIERFYDFSSAHPYPASWRQNCLKAGILADEQELEECEWMKRLLARAETIVADMRGRLDSAILTAGEEDGPGAYLACLSSDALLMDRLGACRTFGDFCRELGKKPDWKRAPGGKRKESVSEKKLARVKYERELVKKNINALHEDYFSKSCGEALETCRKSVDMIRALTKLTDRFEKAFSEAKQERGLVDFADLEHFALDILVKSEEDPSPTPTAMEYRQFFREVMTDEYQDSNFVQEMILNAVSGEPGTQRGRFMVGDVKQSIYRFRQARPALFMEKQETYKKTGSHRRIDLVRNFRSRAQVVDFVNMIFEKIMIRGVGGVEYDEDARLRCGASFGEGPDESLYRPELLIVEKTGENGQPLLPVGMTNVLSQARAIAQKIRQIRGNLPVWDKDLGRYRPADYGDMVVLMRSPGSWGDVFAKELTDCGISARVETGSGYFQTVEVQNLLSMLSILDNPHQDHPLYAVLHSPMGGFTDEELARVRICCPEGDLYTAVRSAAGWEEEKTTGGENDVPRRKLLSFLETYDGLRRLVPFTPIHELIWQILDRTGYLDYAGAMSGGRSRLLNLEMLCARAEVFEQGSYRGLFNFIRYIEKLRKYEVDYAEASMTEEAGQTVRIMSIHKSKGLEFPVVFLAGLDRSFNKTDSRSHLVLHPDLGAACDLIDPEKRIRITSLMRSFIAAQIGEEDMGEELRVLYVAMTRAREKLILCGQVDTFEKALEKSRSLLGRDERQMSVSDLMRAGSFLEMILSVIAQKMDLCEDPLVTVQRVEVTGDKETGEEDDDLLREALHPDPCRVYHEPVRRCLLKIPEPGSVKEEVFIPLKVSVSDLKHAHMDAQLEDEQFLELYQEALEDPALGVGIPHISGEGALRGAALGTLYHRVMELLDFASDEPVQRQLESMVNCGKIHEDERRNIVPGLIEAFLETDLSCRMRLAAKAGALHRETPFVTAEPADRIDPSWDGNQSVLVQGIIDAWFEEEGGIILLDYKTDKVPLGDEQYLVRYYRVQMDCYRSSLERLTGKKVTQSWLYSFALGKAIRVPEQ